MFFTGPVASVNESAGTPDTEVVVQDKEKRSRSRARFVPNIGLFDIIDGEILHTRSYFFMLGVVIIFCAVYTTTYNFHSAIERCIILSSYDENRFQEPESYYQHMCTLNATCSVVLLCLTALVLYVYRILSLRSMDESVNCSSDRRFSVRGVRL